MIHSNGTLSKRLLSATVATSLAFSALLVLGTIAAPAYADEHHDRRGYDRRGDGDYYRGSYGDRYRGGYYNAPPVVYGSPYYAPPPVVYGPGIGIQLPGVAIGIR
jgi:hypothetical protein